MTDRGRTYAGGDVQQPLYTDGWRDQQPHRRRPGESDAEYSARQFARLRAVLSGAVAEPQSTVTPAYPAGDDEHTPSPRRLVVGPVFVMLMDVFPPPEAPRAMVCVR